MSLAERDSLADELLRCIRRMEQRIRNGLSEPVPPELHAGDERGQRGEGSAEVAPRGEDWLLVFLQVAVVRQRQPLHYRQKAHQAAQRCARFGSRQLGDIRVQLLRHH